MMPRATTGPKVKARTLQVLEALLRYANHEVELSADIPGLHCRWQDSPQPTLVVQTTLRSLLELNQRAFPDQPLKKPQVREALNRLHDFLEVLEDYRVHQRGSEDWHFALHLASQETDRAIAAAAKQWKSLKTPQAATPTSNSGASELPPLSGLCRGAPFQVPPLPHYFVDRPEHLNAVKTYLLENTPQRPGTLVVSAIQGLGGIGKSVLAAAIAHDPAVQSHFSDGVLWSTLGQQPDILACLSGWIQELGDHSYKPTTASSASAHLRTLLHDRRMLLVVDDVWDPSHAEPFRVGGSDCCVLVTTREAQIPGVRRYDLDVMTPEQSLSLLKQSIHEELSDSAIQEALALAKAVAYLPLALELAAAQIEDGATWAELLEALEQEIADLDVLDIQGYGFQSQISKQRNLSLLASFNLSLKRLPPEQLHQFAWLGVLPEDVTITETMAATLWDLRPAQARTLLRFLKGRALLLSSGRQADQRVGYRLHDLMHDVARHLLTGDPQPHQSGMLPGLGMTLQEAHQLFMNRYRPKLQNGQWHTIPSDGYIHAHLTWHLEQAELTDEIHQLLQTANSDGKNGWYVACQEIAQTAGFIGDIARAWRLAGEMFEQNPPQSLSLRVRYALIKGSLNTLAGNSPPELIACLVAEGVWQPAQGLAYLQQIPRPWRQVSTFEVILPYLPDTLLPEALKVVGSISDRVCRSIALVELSTRLEEVDKAAQAAIDLIQEKYQRALALGKLASRNSDLWPEVLDAIKYARPVRERGFLFRDLAPRMPPDVLTEAWKVAKQIGDPYSRTIGMVAIAREIPSLRTEAVSRNLEEVKQIGEIFGRTWALGALATLDETLWPDTISSLESMEYDYAKAKLIQNFAPEIPQSWLSELVQIGQSIQHEYRRVIAVGALTTRVPDLLTGVFTDTQVIRDTDWAVRALCALAKKTERVLPVAFKMLTEIRHDHEKIIACCALSNFQPQLWREAYQTASSISDVWSRAWAFESLADWAPEVWPKIAEAAESIQHRHDRAHLLSQAALKMPELWPTAIQAFSELWLESHKARFIYFWLPNIPEKLLSSVIEIARDIQDDFERLLALSAISGKVFSLTPEVLQLMEELEFQGESLYHKALAKGVIAKQGRFSWLEVIDSVSEIQDENLKSSAIYFLSYRFPEELLQQLLQSCLNIESDFYKAESLRHLPFRLEMSSTTQQQFNDLLLSFSSLPRETILEILAPMGDATFALGGEEAIIETAYAIRDVGRQW